MRGTGGFPPPDLPEGLKADPVFCGHGLPVDRLPVMLIDELPEADHQLFLSGDGGRGVAEGRRQKQGAEKIQLRDCGLRLLLIRQSLHRVAQMKKQPL